MKLNLFRYAVENNCRGQIVVRWTLSGMLFVVPVGGSISRGMGILALNAIIGALLGCVIAAVVLIKAVGYLAWWSFSSVIRLFRRN